MSPSSFRSVRVLALVLPAVGLFGCRTIPPRMSAEDLDPSQVALVQRTCSDIMGLRNGEAQFGACSDSLADALHRHAAAQRLTQAHESCEKQGFAPGTPQLASCVVLAQQRDTPAQVDANAASGAVPAATTLADLPAVPKVSFYKMSRPVRHEREQLACARMGIDPVTREFGDCVGELVQSFWDLENPL